MSISASGGGSSIEDKALQMLTLFGDPNNIKPRILEFQKVRQEAETASKEAQADRDLATSAQDKAHAKLAEVEASLKNLNQQQAEFKLLQEQQVEQTKKDKEEIETAREELKGREGDVEFREQKVTAIELEIQERLSDVKEKQASVDLLLAELSKQKEQILQFAQSLQTKTEEES